MDLSRVWDNFPHDLIVNVAGSILILVLGRLVWLLGAALRRFLQISSPRAFSLSGSWGGTCRLPSYPPDVEAVEIYRLIVRGDQVEITFFNYRPDIPHIARYKGRAVWRGSLFSAFYYMPAAENFDSGVIALRLEGNTLAGVYAQFDPNAGDALKVSHPKQEDYRLVRVTLPLWAKLRLTFGAPPFRDHDEARSVFDAARKPRSAQADA